MIRPTLIIEIAGGVLQSVTSSCHIDYFLVDHDNIKEGGIGEVFDMHEADLIVENDSDIVDIIKEKIKDE